MMQVAQAESYVRLAYEAALRGDLPSWEWYSKLADIAFQVRARRLGVVMPGDSTSVN